MMPITFMWSGLFTGAGLVSSGSVNSITEPSLIRRYGSGNHESKTMR